MSELGRTTRSASSTEDIVQAAERRLTELIKSVRTDLQASIKAEISEIREKVCSVEHDVSVQSEELSKLRRELDEERKQRLFYQKQVTLKDMHDRKPNLLFYGISESPQENTERVLREFLVKSLNFQQDRIDSMMFKVVHRLPLSEYQRQNNPSAVRSIIATFIYMPDRDAVFAARKLLKQTRISIQTDLPPMLKKRRAILSRQAASIREEKKIWTRVRVVDAEVVLETRDPQVPGSGWIKFE